MKALIEGKRYDTAKATQIASDRYWDGHNWERRGRNTYLYRTAKGNFFAHRTTCWQGERDRIEPLDQQQAIALYESLPEHDLAEDDAFPNVVFEDA